MTTSTGHAFCSERSQPNMTALNTEEDVLRLEQEFINSIPQDVVDLKWDWHKFQSQDKKLIELLRKSVNITILDFVPMTFL